MFQILFSSFPVRFACCLVAALALSRPACGAGSLVLTPPESGRWQTSAGAPEARFLRTAQGERLIGLTAPFADPAAPSRVYWDVATRLDLRTSRTVRFRFRCPDPAGASHLSLYLRSGEGWYTGDVPLRAAPGWQEARLDVLAMRTEGTPAGLTGIDMVRVGLWKQSGQDVSLLMTPPETELPDPDLLVLRELSSIAAGSAAVRQYTRTVVDALEARGLHPAVVEDVEVNSAHLKPFPVVVLPFNPTPGARLSWLVKEYLRGGGHVVGWYVVDSGVADLMGFGLGKSIRADDLPNGIGGIGFRDGMVSGLPAYLRQESWVFQELQPKPGRSRELGRWTARTGAMTEHTAAVVSERGAWTGHVLLADDPEAAADTVLALVGRHLPRAWPRASAHALRGIGESLPFADPANRRQELARLSRGSPALQSRLREAQLFVQQALSLHRRADYPAAVKAARRADESLLDVYFRTRRERSPEFRGVWVQDPEGLPPRSWAETAAGMQRCGITDVFLRCLSGSAGTPGLPVLSEETRGHLHSCLRACRVRGIRVHLWDVVAKLPESTTRANRARLRAAGALAQTAGGEATWLCPSHPHTWDRHGDALEALLREFPFSGVHLDYIRMPGLLTCTCPRCRRQFETAVGQGIAGWPTALRQAAFREKWESFRVQQIHHLVSGLRKSVKAARGNALMSAAVWPDPEQARSRYAQDWSLWARSGCIDALCPMNYTADPHAFRRLLGEQRHRVPARVPILPGIGVSLNGLGAVGVVQQIEAVHEARLSGYVFFCYDARFEQDILPGLSRGIARPRGR